MVHTSNRKGRVSVDVLKAGSTKYLAGTRYMLNAHETVVVCFSCGLLKRRANDTECGIIGELCEEIGEIVLANRYVGIQDGENIKFEIPNTTIGRIHRMSFPAEASGPTLGHPHQLDPWACRRIVVDDGVSLVGRPIADDNPLHGCNRLSNDRLYYRPDELCFISGSSNDDVS